MKTLTYWIEYNPSTGTKKPFELFVSCDNDDQKKQHCSSSATLEGAEKSRSRFVSFRKEYFNFITPEYKA